MDGRNADAFRTRLVGLGPVHAESPDQSGSVTSPDTPVDVQLHALHCVAPRTAEQRRRRGEMHEHLA